MCYHCGMGIYTASKAPRPYLSFRTLINLLDCLQENASSTPHLTAAASKASGKRQPSRASRHIGS
jgi:hypothetical protein